jgi:hypothetical protein
MAKRARQRRPDWSAKLTRSLTLKTGDKLVTLADARAALIRYFDNGRAKPVLLSRSHTLKAFIAFSASARLIYAASWGPTTCMLPGAVADGSSETMRHCFVAMSCST